RTGTHPTAATRLTERLLTEAREELRRADAKATQWLGLFGGALLALATGLVGASWSPHRLTGTAVWTWWTGCLAAALALAAVMMALLPRTGGDPELRLVAYFGHVHRLRDPEEVRRHVERAAHDTMPSLISQLCWISRLAMTKYRWTRAGTVLAMFAAALIAVSLL
ncbi:Pycsar system effector family protein, partial [Micromonospora sp. D75]